MRDTSSELSAISRFKAMESLNPQSNGNFSRQSQTILRDLKHHSLPKKRLFFLGAAEQGLDLLFTGPATIRQHCLR
jgi:hypothetical protein